MSRRLKGLDGSHPWLASQRRQLVPSVWFAPPPSGYTGPTVAELFAWLRPLTAVRDAVQHQLRGDVATYGVSAPVSRGP